jgi:hypothetical protein
MHLLQRAHVDDDAAADLRLSERLMTLTARDDLQAEATREADDARDVALRAGPQHCDRLFVDDPVMAARLRRENWEAWLSVIDQ